MFFTTTMTTIIDQRVYGTNAFVKYDYGMQIVMNAGSPCVEWSFRVKELQQWLTTLEETMVREENAGNRRNLESMYFSLKAAHNRHLEQHKEIVTEAPTADDLLAYLADYAAAVGGQG